MKVSLNINGEARLVDVASPAPACRFRIGDGVEREAQVETPEPGVYSVLVEGQSYDAFIEERPEGGLVVLIDGHRFEIDVDDPRRWTRNAGGRGASGVQQVTAPMPGKVVRVLIAPGDAVKAGQALVVVEAMKMQNELKAARAGTVATVPVKEGATVKAGEVLATIE